jgi:hypothetical protein
MSNATVKHTLQESTMIQAECGPGETERSHLCVKLRAMTNTERMPAGEESFQRDILTTDRTGENPSDLGLPVGKFPKESVSLGRVASEPRNMGHTTDVSEYRNGNGHLHDNSINMSKTDCLVLHPRQSQSSEGKQRRLAEEGRVDFKLSRRTLRKRILAKYEENLYNENLLKRECIPSISPLSSPFACTRW